ncbi:MAG: hypothetical protein K2L12_06020 [Clostridia bacterium]|nr:hypothetical protein [Clostridia bacterium]
MEHSDYVKINPGTVVTRTILNNLSSPDDELKIIHIAGTNGKGSTAEYFTRILISAGKKVGTFTSPAVYSFYDQFRINGENIPKEKIERYFERALKASEGLGATDFEIQTAGVILAFKEEGCEYAVIECGMGGLGDATNAINKKALAVITSISLEHTAYLGDTIEKICEQKAGIIKDCPAVINAFQPTEARAYFKALGAHFAEVSSQDLQTYNAQTAIDGARILGIPDKAIYEGIKNAKLAGRVEKLSADRNYILDGAHNPASFEPLKQYLRSIPNNEITIIFGCLADKDIDGNLACLAGTAKNIIAVECTSPRKMGLDKIYKACKKYFANATTASGVLDGLNKAYTKTVVVCGSFTLLKEAKEWIEKKQLKR